MKALRRLLCRIFGHRLQGEKREVYLNGTGPDRIMLLQKCARCREWEWLK